MKKPKSAYLAFVFLLAQNTVADQTDIQALDEIIVFGRVGVEQIGSAEFASNGLVGYEYIGLAPMLRVGELVETVPGMVATQHPSTGKANQYFLRGFNLDHGTDFAASADGVPLNLCTHNTGASREPTGEEKVTKTAQRSHHQRRSKARRRLADGRVAGHQQRRHVQTDRCDPRCTSRSSTAI